MRFSTALLLQLFHFSFLHFVTVLQFCRSRYYFLFGGHLLLLLARQQRRH